MNHLENRIEESRNLALKQMELERVIINILDNINPHPRCSEINKEHLYTAVELESMFKIRRDKKEQFQHLLDMRSDSQKINSTIYYSLAGMLDHLPSNDGLATLTYYFDERGKK